MNMQVEVKSFQELFQAPLHCEIPIFQRPYVWTEKNQWEPMWEDIRATAENYLDRLTIAGGDSTKAQDDTPKHFMGAIVLQQKPSPIGAPKTALVIDGQQRLTTIQLLLDAAQNVFVELQANNEAEQLQDLVRNRRTEGAQRFKVWPAHHDRDAFRATMEGAGNHPRIDSAIVDAHAYFRSRLLKWIGKGNPSDVPDSRVAVMCATLCGLVTIATIELGTRDDPFVIFETLNARGTPLTQADLVKNYILRRSEDSDNTSYIYDRLWKPLERGFWRENVRTGALTRTQLDTFLQYWLASATLKEVRTERVFREFREHTESIERLAGTTIDEVARDLRSAADVYESWHVETRRSRSKRGLFFERGWRCGLGSFSPLLLWLEVNSKGELDDNELLSIFHTIESYLVRRALCRVMTAGLTQIGMACINELTEWQPRDWLNRLEAFLSNGDGRSRWPSDGEVADSLLRQPVYGRIGGNKVRMMLEAIEDHLRSDDSFGPDTAFERGKLSIEHVMPRAWRANWRLPVDSSVTDAERDLSVDVLGNLTLVNQKLNSSVSNGPWRLKRDALGNSSTLYLTKNLIKSEDWDERAINARGKELLEHVLTIWPRPKHSEVD